MKKYLQYAFFMSENGEFYSCDKRGEELLASIDINNFYNRLQILKLNAATTTTTAIINNTSYSLRMIPVNSLDRNQDVDILGSLKEGFLIILQNQSLFSSIIHHLSKSQFEHNHFEKIFQSYDDGIFLTQADGVALYVNDAYQSITNIDPESVIGQSVYAMESEGLFTPLVTPTILQTSRDYTVFQAFATGKYAIISGSPIYDSLGNAVLILICATSLTNPHLIQLSKNLFLPQTKDSFSDIYPDTYIDVIAESDEMHKVVQDIIKVAHFDVPVLLLGESGTGKEVLSSIIHTTSKRRCQPFIKVNCSAISQTLLEAELFGYEAGAFTGASSKGKPGLFEVADKGTILLDEIGDMPLDSQAKLLRVVQSGEIFRVGGLSSIKVNVRIIAATNKDLLKMVQKGTFRNDLYYRLNVISIQLPPLRYRRKDIIPLLLHYCYLFNKKYGTNKNYSKELLTLLEQYDWPGNIRELRNLVERMIILCINDTFKPHDLYNIYDRELRSEFPSNEGDESIVTVEGIPPLGQAVSQLEKTIVERAMKKTRNTRKAADLLHVSQSTIMRKIKEHRIGIEEDVE